jgi:hypothetical protein
MHNFTPPAQKLWNKIPAEVRMQILNSVWCASCRDTVTMLNITGNVEGGDLVLKGKCARCAGPVSRLIESD